VSNADKGVFEKEMVLKRIENINSLGWNVMITQIPYFSDKNVYLKNGYFILGTDTFKRLIDTKYYEDSYEIMVGKLGEFRKRNNKIVFASRLDAATGKVMTIEDLKVPQILKNITIEIEFRLDISSSEIRKTNLGQQESELKVM